jgi:hypothetical protein
MMIACCLPDAKKGGQKIETNNRLTSRRTAAKEAFKDWL